MGNFDWTKLIEPAFSLGGGLALGAYQNSQVPASAKAQNALTQQGLQQQQQQYNTTRGDLIGERNRRNMISGASAPSLLWALGHRDPAKIQEMTNKLSAPVQSTSQPLGATSGNPAAGSYGSASEGNRGGITGALGTAGGAALGTAIAPGVGTAIGAAVGGLGSLAGKVGAGRRTADSAVQNYENPFGADLAQVARLKDEVGDVAAAKQLFEQSYAKYMNSIQAELAAGGNRAKVANQSLQNQALQSTVKTMAQQLGVQL